MFEERYYSTDNDFKTAFYSKVFLVLGIILLSFFIFFEICSIILSSSSTGVDRQIYDISTGTIPGSLLAFSLICFAVCIILYFFYTQFAKLAQIAEEVENDESLIDEDFNQVE